MIGGYVECLQVYFCRLAKVAFDVIAEQPDVCIGKNYGTKKLRYKARRWIYERVCKDDLGSYIVTIVHSIISCPQSNRFVGCRTVFVASTGEDGTKFDNETWR